MLYHIAAIIKEPRNSPDNPLPSTRRLDSGIRVYRQCQPCNVRSYFEAIRILVAISKFRG